MISKEDIKKLADLARIKVEESEVEGLAKDLDSILEYVGQVKSVAGNLDQNKSVGSLKNVMREDLSPTESGTYSKELLEEMPEKEGDYLKVKKILG